ncbi:MAG: SPOR domain-containing protein [Draconibacterium sp.]
MKLHKFIQQLLQDNEMVIIPGLGAFIQEYQPAEISEDSDEIKPPSTRLTFNPQIRNNDGLLVGYVADNTRDSHFEALQKIEKERDNWVYKLDKGEKVELDGIGTFSNNKNGELIFISEEDQKHSLDSFGLETTSLEENGELETTPEAEETIAANEQQAETPDISEDVTESETPEVEQDEPIETVAIETLEEPEEITQNTVAEVQEEETEPKKNPQPAATVTPEPEKDKKRKGGWWWLLLILIPLIAVSVFLLMKEKQPTEPTKTTPPAEVSSEQETQNVVNDSIQPDSTLSMAVDSTAVSVVETKKTEPKDSTGFFLVGGSFKAQENAETYLQQLKEQGYEPFHLGKYGSFYIVGIGRYNTEKEALEAKDTYTEANPGSGVWVLEK